ncbi:7408_t:CDS:2, partial [Dentiscutata heterogama]
THGSVRIFKQAESPQECSSKRKCQKSTRGFSKNKKPPAKHKPAKERKPPNTTIPKLWDHTSKAPIRRHRNDEITPAKLQIRRYRSDEIT